MAAKKKVAPAAPKKVDQAAEKAAWAGDDQELLAQLRRSPARGASALIARLKKATDGSLDALAVSASKMLRITGNPALALQVASLGARRSRALRAEEALASLGAGDEARFAEILGQDPALAAALEPVEKALRGEAPGSQGALPPGARALCGCVAAAVRGDEAAFEAALGDKALGDKALKAALRSAQALASGRGATEETVLGHVHVLFQQGVGEVACEEVAGRFPEVALSQPQRWREHPAALRRALAGGMRAGMDAERLCRVMAVASHRAFDPAEQPLAALYEAFGLRGQPGASKALDVAEKGGVDPVEVQRGRWLAAQGPKGVSGKGELKQLDLLSERLLAQPDGAALAAYAARATVAGWAQYDKGKARAALARARLAAERLGHERAALERDLTVAEITFSPEMGHEGAQARLDEVLREDPGHRQAWHTKLELLSLREQDGDARDLALIAAAKAISDPELLAEARSAELRQKKRAPFEGLGPAPAAQLADEFHDALGGAGEKADVVGMFVSLSAAAAHLPEPHRFAVSLAALDAVLSLLDGARFAVLLNELAERLVASPERFLQLLSFSILAGEPEAAAMTLGVVDATQLGARWIEELIKVFGHHEEFALAREVLADLGEALPAARRKALAAQLKKSESSGAAIACEKSCSADYFGGLIRSVLGEEYELDSFSDDPGGPFGDGFLLDDVPDVPARAKASIAAAPEQFEFIISTLAAMMGASKKETNAIMKTIDRMGHEQKAGLFVHLMRMLEKGPEQGGEEALKMLKELQVGKVKF